MAAYLMRWLNSSNLGKEVTCLEKQLANGYLLGKLLHNRGMISLDAFNELSESFEFEARVKNYSLIDEFLVNMGVEYKPNIIGKIILEERGQATKLLYLVKCALDPEIAPCKNTFNPEAKEEDEIIEEEVIRARIPPNSKMMVQALKGKLTKKQFSLFLRMDEFDQIRIQNEMDCDKLERKELEQIKEIQAKARQERIERLREGQIFFKNWVEEGKKSWKANQERFLEWEQRDLKFELTWREQDRVKSHNAKVEHTNEMQLGVYTFERNLKRLGVDTEDDSSAEKKRQSDGNDANNLPLADRVKMAMDGNKVEVASYIEKIKQDRQEAIRARKDREQRRRKIYVEQQRTQQNANKTHQMKLLLKSIDDQSRIEREEAGTLRIKRSENKKLKQKHKAIAVKSIQNRNVKFREQVFRDNEIFSQKRSEYLSSKEYQTVLSERKEKQTAKSKRKREKATIACTKALDLIIDGAIEASLNRPMPHSSWIEKKQRVVDGTISIEPNSESTSLNIENLDEAILGKLDSEYKDLQTLSGKWQVLHCDDDDIGQKHCFKDILGSLEILTQKEESLPKIENPIPGIRICAIGPAKSGKTSLSVRISHCLGIKLMKPSEVVDKAKQCYKEEKQRIETLGDEDNLDDDLMGDTTRSLLDLGKFIEEQGFEDDNQALDSIEFGRAMSLMISDLEESEWILDGFPRTLEQARMLDHTLSKKLDDPEVPESFDDFCKAQDKMDRDSRICSLTCAIQVAMHRYCTDSNTEDNEEFVEKEHDYNSWCEGQGWFEDWFKGNFIKLEGYDAPNTENEEEKLDSENSEAESSKVQYHDQNIEESAENAASICNSPRDRVLKEVVLALAKVFDVVLPVISKNNGINLYRAHLEAMDPFGSGDVIELEAVRKLWDNHQTFEADYRQKCIKTLHSLAEMNKTATQESEELFEGGIALINGTNVPPGIKTVQQLQAELEYEWDRTIIEDIKNLEERIQHEALYRRSKGENVKAQLERDILKEKSKLKADAKHFLVYYEDKVFDQIISYSKLAESIINQWQTENVSKESTNLLCNIFHQLVDLETEYYSNLRETAKKYFDVVEKPKSLATCEIKDSLIFKEKGHFFGRTQTEKAFTQRVIRAKSSIELRRSRGENHKNPNPDSLTKTLTEINFLCYGKICGIDLVAKTISESIRTIFEEIFSKLRESLKKQVSTDIDNMKRSLENMKKYIFEISNMEGFSEI